MISIEMGSNSHIFQDVEHHAMEFYQNLTKSNKFMKKFNEYQ